MTRIVVPGHGAEHDDRRRAAYESVSHAMSGPNAFTEASLREPLRRLLAERRALSAAPQGGLGKASAVLVPLFELDGEVHTWLVALRARAGMRDHSGQVAFPGGKHDATDESLLTTALREAEEEIGARARGASTCSARSTTTR